MFQSVGRQGLVAVVAGIRSIMRNRSHPGWVGLQQIGTRGFAALKYLLAAKLLGPHSIGTVGIALFVLAIAELASDTGLVEAMVQRPAEIDEDERGTVWTLLVARGAVMCVILAMGAVPLAMFFHDRAVVGLVLCAALIPLPRNALNPGMALAERARNFRARSLAEISASMLDFALSMLLIRLGSGPIGLLVGTLASEAWRCALSWTAFRVSIHPNLRWSEIPSLTSFGKWVWSSGLVSLALNQVDKVVVAKLLGATEFGLYQVAGKIAQILIADSAAVFAQYLYPTFAQSNRESPLLARAMLSRAMRMIVPLLLVLAVTVVVFAGPVLHVLGPRWQDGVLLLRLMAVVMAISAVISVYVVYLRAIGRPQAVTHATVAQLATLCVALPIGFHLAAAPGIVLALGVAGSVAVALMIFIARVAA